MACTPAPACVAVRVQASLLWPNRSQASDGICASSQHTAVNPGSDHEPHVVVGGKAYATAVDLTDDKANGCDADAWAEWLVTTRDRRVKYVIRNREMCSSYPTSRYPAWTWRPYTGANPHDKHTHVSILADAIFDTAPWFREGDPDDMLTPDESAWLSTIHHELRNPESEFSRWRKSVDDRLELLTKGASGFGVDPPPIATDRILDLVRQIAAAQGIDVDGA